MSGPRGRRQHCHAGGYLGIGEQNAGSRLRHTDHRMCSAGKVEYALQVSALGYLTKPVTTHSLETALAGVGSPSGGHSSLTMTPTHCFCSRACSIAVIAQSRDDFHERRGGAGRDRNQRS